MDENSAQPAEVQGQSINPPSLVNIHITPSHPLIPPTNQTHDSKSKIQRQRKKKPWAIGRDGYGEQATGYWPSSILFISSYASLSSSIKFSQSSRPFNYAQLVPLSELLRCLFAEQKHGPATLLQSISLSETIINVLSIINNHLLATYSGSSSSGDSTTATTAAKRTTTATATAAAAAAATTATPATAADPRGQPAVAWSHTAATTAPAHTSTPSITHNIRKPVLLRLIASTTAAAGTAATAAAAAVYVPCSSWKITIPW